MSCSREPVKWKVVWGNLVQLNTRWTAACWTCCRGFSSPGGRWQYEHLCCLPGEKMLNPSDVVQEEYTDADDCVYWEPQFVSNPSSLQPKLASPQVYEYWWADLGTHFLSPAGTHAHSYPELALCGVLTSTLRGLPGKQWCLNLSVRWITRISLLWLCAQFLYSIHYHLFCFCFNLFLCIYLLFPMSSMIYTLWY